MNIENAKIAIDKMSAFLPDYVLNDLYKDHNAAAHIISKDDNKVIFSVIFNDGEKRILTITVKRHEINVHYNGTMQVFSQLINAEFYSDIVNVLFPEDESSDAQGALVSEKTGDDMNSLNTADFLKTINSLRLQNKGKWYAWQGVVNNKTVVIKGFNTWLQLFLVDGLQCGNCSDRSVKDFKNDLASAVA